MRWLNELPKTKPNEERKGFTLVELVVVIAILGILVTVAIPRYIDVTHGSREIAFEANHRLVIAAVITYESKYTAAPSSLNDVLPFLNDDVSDIPTGAVYDVTNGAVTSTYSLHRNPNKRVLSWTG